MVCWKRAAHCCSRPADRGSGNFPKTIKVHDHRLSVDKPCRSMISMARPCHWPRVGVALKPSAANSVHRSAIAKGIVSDCRQPVYLEKLKIAVQNRKEHLHIRLSETEGVMSDHGNGGGRSG